MRILPAALCGFVLDLILGDPAWLTPVHPVVLMGRAISALEKRLRAVSAALCSLVLLSSVPAMAASCRVMVLRMVDFPAPLGPIRVTIFPLGRVKSMSRIRAFPR